MKKLTVGMKLLAALGVLLVGVFTGSVHAQTDLTCEDLAPVGVPPAYFLGLGNAFFAEADYTLAIAAYTCALERDPAYAPAYVNRGFAHVAQQNNTQAMDDYNRALELDEGLIVAYNYRGMLYMREGNFGLALGDFTIAVTLDPAYAPGYHNRGLVHAAERNYALALDDLQQAIALDPTFAAPHAALGAVYSALALNSYEDFAALAGPGIPLPFGEPDDIIREQVRGRAVEDFAMWLDFLTR